MPLGEMSFAYEMGETLVGELPMEGMTYYPSNHTSKQSLFIVPSVTSKYCFVNLRR